MKNRVCLLSCERPLNFFETSFGARMNPFDEDEALIAAFKVKGVRADRMPWDTKNVDWSEFDGVIVRSTWDYFTRCEEFLATIDSIATHVPVWNSPKMIRWNSNKHYLEELAKKGIPVVKTRYIESMTPLKGQEVAKKEGWTRFVVKPVIGGGALQTYRLPQDEKAYNQLSTDACSEFMLQPFMRNIESEGEWSFIFFGGEFQYAVRKTPARGDYRVQLIYGAAAAITKPNMSDLQTARHVLKHIDEPTLYARIDMVRNDSGILELMELELIEPTLSLLLVKDAPSQFVDAWLRCQLIHHNAIP